jgi:hypothetical protein
VLGRRRRRLDHVTHGGIAADREREMRAAQAAELPHERHDLIRSLLSFV